MRETLTRWRYRVVPDHLLGEVLAKNWIDNAIPFVILALTLAVLGTLIPGLLTLSGIGGLSAQFGELLLVVIAMTIVMLGGGIDLSVGSVFALANFVTLALFNMLGWPIPVVIVVALARIVWRRTTPLPDWCPSLSESERRISHRLETLLYLLMFALPVSGYLFVMLGGYGVRLFGLHDLPNPFGKQPLPATIAWVCHVLLAYGVVVTVAWHVGLGLKKHLFDRSGFLNRMLPFRGGR